MCRDCRRSSHTHSEAAEVTAEGFEPCLQPVPWQRRDPGEAGEILPWGEAGSGRDWTQERQQGREGFSSLSLVHPGKSKALSQGGSLRSRGGLSHLLSLGQSSAHPLLTASLENQEVPGNAFPDSTKSAENRGDNPRGAGFIPLTNHPRQS